MCVSVPGHLLFMTILLCFIFFSNFFFYFTWFTTVSVLPWFFFICSSLLFDFFPRSHPHLYAIYWYSCLMAEMWHWVRLVKLFFSFRYYDFIDTKYLWEKEMVNEILLFTFFVWMLFDDAVVVFFVTFRFCWCPKSLFVVWTLIISVSSTDSGRVYSFGRLALDYWWVSIFSPLFFCFLCTLQCGIIKIMIQHWS